MDRNLGASRVATSINDVGAYGDYYQWGRGADGHQKGTSTTTTIRSNEPQNSSFIIRSDDPKDWRISQNNNLWQGVNGTNNPCPSGFRLPTIKEWEEEVATWGIIDGAFGSKLKLPFAGHRLNLGTLGFVGGGGFYWSSTFANSPNIYSAFQLSLVGNPNVNSMEFRSYGNCVRCIKN